MAASVSSGGRYDVFINFKREDTRKIFIGHLYKALVQKSIHTFIDGDDPELPTIIQESRLSIVVFSENYASSTRCLKQLVHILDRVDTKKHVMVPIFYQIDPSDVRKLSGRFGKAFAQHDCDEVQSWRSALTKAVNFSGWASRDYRDEAKFIEGVVQDIFNQLLQFSKVFVSFRGADTRKGFAAHLVKALHQNVLSTYTDVSADIKGDEITASLRKVVQQARISIVIFSEHYAESRWCLDELVAILECADRNNQKVVPVFYGVDPSDVRKATRSFADAFAGHMKRYSNNMEMVTLWRSALTIAANISGFDGKDYKDDAKLIEAIVRDTWEACRDFERILDGELE